MLAFHVETLSGNVYGSQSEGPQNSNFVVPRMWFHITLLNSFVLIFMEPRLCARSWLSGNLGKTALRLLEIMPMYYDTSLKTSRIDLSALFSPRPLSRNGNFFFLFQGFGRKRDGRERRNPQGHGRHYACTN